jgi:hypothetical protein
MASSFPSSLDSFTNPSSTDAMDSVSVPHATQHADLNDAVEALEAKVGADSSAVSSSHDYKIAQLEAGATGGKILQVVSTTKTDTFSTTSTSYTDITGLSVAITPTSATSKILVLFSVNTGASAANSNAFVLVRDSTEISIGDAAGSREQATVVNTVTAANFRMSAHHAYLDSPATTSATTYKVQTMSQGATLTVNYASGDTDTGGAVFARSTSYITVMEVSA